MFLPYRLAISSLILGHSVERVPLEPQLMSIIILDMEDTNVVQVELVVDFIDNSGSEEDDKKKQFEDVFEDIGVSFNALLGMIVQVLREKVCKSKEEEEMKEAKQCEEALTHKAKARGKGKTKETLTPNVLPHEPQLEDWKVIKDGGLL
ncbi:hypothetical protein AMTR_s00018p00221200 [Amborella trichopoda]|uniref:Uncharacterized protein n=1 Tax=Amborella trichopoda TaxID=13333 RepID=W1PKQ8_AMBTC|nr:hypothetical protein AMTR_s00018p00221200 [Amborella trichopoda]